MQRNITKQKKQIYRPKQTISDKPTTDQNLTIAPEKAELVEIKVPIPSQNIVKQKGEADEDTVFMSNPSIASEIYSSSLSEPEVKNSVKPSRIENPVNSPKNPHKKFFYRAKQVTEIQASESCDDDANNTQPLSNLTISKKESKAEVGDEYENNTQTLELREEKETIGVQSPTEIAKFVGPYADNYADLYYFIKSQSNATSWPIANFSDDNRLYIVETEEAKDAARTFLQFYWSDQANVDATIQLQQKKHKKEARNAREAIMASCANFVLTTIDSKPYCFIGLSVPREGAEEFYDSLTSFINEFNQKQDVEYVLINGSTGNFSKLISAFAGKTTFATFRTCAEKTLASFFTKLWMSGTDFFLQGGISILIFPFIPGERYGQAASSAQNRKIKEIKPFIKDGAVVNILKISKNHFTPIIMCCPACQETRPIVFKIWHGAKAFHEASKKQQKSGDKLNVRSTSPIRRSIESKTSLHSLSVFNTANSNESPREEDSRKWRRYSRSVFLDE